MTVVSKTIQAAKARLLGAEGGPQAGVALLREAAERGDPQAANLMATLCASGAWMPQSWPMALDFLALAAERGSLSAQGQLLLLAREGETWQARREAIPMEAWLAPPNRRPLCEHPRVRTSEAFIPPPMCDWLIGLAQGRLQPAKMVESYGGEARLTPDRTNSDFVFDIFGADCVLALVRERISALVKLPIAAMEPPQIFHYATGQELRPHVDYLQRADRIGVGSYEGDRIATVLVYLNDGFEGGETWFPRPDLKVKAAKGDALYFANVDAAGAPDPESLHAGLPPLRGEKWLLSQWIHDRPFGG